MLVTSNDSFWHIANLDEAFNTLKKYQMRLNLNKCTFSIPFGKLLKFMVSQWRIKVNLEKIQAILDMAHLTMKKEVQKLTG